MRRLNVAMIGHRFMGKAHSNAWRQAARFFETPFEPVLKVVCGRDPSEVERAARQNGWEESSTSWRETVVAASALVFIPHPALTLRGRSKAR